MSVTRPGPTSPRPCPQYRPGVWLWVACLGICLALALAGAALPWSPHASHGACQRLDEAVTAWVVAHRSPLLTPVAWGLTHLGGTTGLSLLTVIVCLTLAWHDYASARERDERCSRLPARATVSSHSSQVRRGCPSARGRRDSTVHAAHPWWERATVFLGAMLTSSVLTHVLKVLAARARPSHDLLLGPPSLSYSFPSGHSLNTAVAMGALALLLAVTVPPARRRRLATWLIPAAVVTATAVAASRVYLAYHWLTDVLAGLCLGLALVSLLAWAVLRRWK